MCQVGLALRALLTVFYIFQFSKVDQLRNTAVEKSQIHFIQRGNIRNLMIEKVNRVWNKNDLLFLAIFSSALLDFPAS